MSEKLADQLRVAHDRLNCLITESGAKTPETRDQETQEAMALCWKAADALDAKDALIATRDAEIARLTREIEQTREILAYTDYASLPHDFSVTNMAESRIADLQRARELHATSLRRHLEDTP